MDGAPAKARPKDRRLEIARNAGELFSSRGFHAVRMDDIAQASDITARALYRHYANKQALLSHVVLENQQRLMDALAMLTSRPAVERKLDESLLAVAEAALDSRQLSLLWQREARHLEPDDYRRSIEQSRWMAEQFKLLLIDPDRSDLDRAAAEIRSWAVVSVLTSSVFYEHALSRQRLKRELIAASARVIAAPGAPVDIVERVEDARGSSSRREQLIDSAARAFRRRGFGGVSIDDIGAEVGVVGPALYRYFDTKADILVAVVTRLQEWQALEMARAMQTAGSDEEVLEGVVRGYIRIALEATDLLAVSLTEQLYIPVGVRERLDRVRADAIGEWQRWLSAARPEVSDALAVMLVNSARAIVDDCVRIPHLREHPNFKAELTRSTLAALDLTES